MCTSITALCHPCSLNITKSARPDMVHCYSPRHLFAEYIEQQLCFRTVKAMHLCCKSISDQQPIGCQRNEPLQVSQTCNNPISIPCSIQYTHTRQSTHIAYLEKQSKVPHQAHTYVVKNVSIASDFVMSSASSCLELFEGGVDALLDVSIGH